MKQVTNVSFDETLLKEIDGRVKQVGFDNRSSYLQYLAERDIHKKKINKENIILVTVLLLFGMVTLALLLGRI